MRIHARADGVNADANKTGANWPGGPAEMPAGEWTGMPHGPNSVAPSWSACDALFDRYQLEEPSSTSSVPCSCDHGTGVATAPQDCSAFGCVADFSAFSEAVCSFGPEGVVSPQDCSGFGYIEAPQRHCGDLDTVALRASSEAEHQFTELYGFFDQSAERFPEMPQDQLSGSSSFSTSNPYESALEGGTLCANASTLSAASPEVWPLYHESIRSHAVYKQIG